MSEQEQNTPKRPKRIRFGKFPVIIGIGGKSESKDIKLMFIEKGIKKHFTIRIISDKEQGKLILDFHNTDETKDKITNKKEAYTSLMKVIFDLKAVEKDADKINSAFLALLGKMMISIENNSLLEGRTIIPIAHNSPLLPTVRSGKDLVIEDNGELAKVISSIHTVDDLGKLGFKVGTVMEGNKARGVVFIKDGKWNYLDMLAFSREIFFLLEPYLSIDGIMTKEQFFAELKIYPLGHVV